MVYTHYSDHSLYSAHSLYSDHTHNNDDDANDAVANNMYSPNIKVLLVEPFCRRRRDQSRPCCQTTLEGRLANTVKYESSKLNRRYPGTVDQALNRFGISCRNYLAHC